MLHTVLTVVLGLWLAGILPLGIFVGRAIALGQRDVERPRSWRSA